MALNNLAKFGIVVPIAISLSLNAIGPVRADEPTLRRVTYTVYALNSTDADIYYRDIDPPTWADYSHDPYQFSPKAEAHVGPDQKWVLEANLADPNQWAMVVVTSGPSQAIPMFRCELAVDGVVVRSGEGPKGALCSLRNW